jgi:diguanylate cyclase (GGDEF)-like protein
MIYRGCFVMQEYNTSTAQQLTEVTPQKPVVLVVDDARTMLSSINRILADDFKILEARDGEEAWEMIIRQPVIHVVLSDLMMPRKNGFQLLRQIRESRHDRINQLPVIIITGHEDDAKMKQRAMALGASDFISKPFDSIQIKARARSYAKHGDTSRKLEYTRKILKQKSTIDTLTGLANPRFFKEHGRGLLAFAARQGTDVAVLRISIDKFDLLVQKKGHQVANRVLLNVSKILNACVRAEDSVARVGRGKFAILMPGASEAGAKVLAKRIHQLIRNAVYKLGEVRFRMTASAALVCHSRDRNIPFEKILDVAEAHLSKAIQEGGNRLILDNADNADAQQSAVANKEAARSVGLERALTLLKAGQADVLRDQLGRLLSEIYPLLEYSNDELHLGMEAVLIKLRERLERI